MIKLNQHIMPIKAPYLSEKEWLFHTSVFKIHEISF